MTLKAAIKRHQERSPEWDELAQRRLLNGVHAAHQRRTERRRTTTRRMAIAAAIVVAFALGAWGLATLNRDGGTRSAEKQASLGKAAEAHAGQSYLSLVDGSRAILEEGSVVDTKVQSEDLVRLSQRLGRVRYEVTPDPDREFVVEAGSHEVRVLGTVFTVEVTADRLLVAVERGRVEVGRPGRTLVLAGGERVDLPLTAVEEPVASVVPPDSVEAERPVVPPDAGDTGTESPPTETPPSVDELLQRADAARRAGRPRDAARALRTLVRAHRKDSRAPSAWFMLGRVERQRGRHAAAARAFRSASASASNGTLAEDARAEEAVSWDRAELDDRARAAAKAYLERYPNGTHRARVEAIVR